MEKVIYFAAALFCTATQEFNRRVKDRLEAQGFSVFFPQEECNETMTSKEIFTTCLNGLRNSQIVITMLEGADVDSGTSWELGWAFARNKPIIGFRSDFRKNGDDGGLNCMLSQSLVFNASKDVDTLVATVVRHYGHLISRQAATIPHGC